MMLNNIYILLACHALGDYFLQIDFIAKTKGNNWWHLFIHSLLYTVPFYLYFGMDYRLIILLVTHFFVDALKSRYDCINYITDQCLHILIAICLYY